MAGNTLIDEEKFGFTTRDGSWKEAKLLEINNAGDTTQPKIAFDSLGNAIAVWEQSDGTSRNIWVNRFTPTSGWINAEKIENDDRGSAESPEVSIDDLGNAIIVWQQSDGIRTNILVNHFK